MLTKCYLLANVRVVVSETEVFVVGGGGSGGFGFFGIMCICFILVFYLKPLNGIP